MFQIPLTGHKKMYTRPTGLLSTRRTVLLEGGSNSVDYIVRTLTTRLHIDIFLWRWGAKRRKSLVNQSARQPINACELYHT